MDQLVEFKNDFLLAKSTSFIKTRTGGEADNWDHYHLIPHTSLDYFC